ncbi:MAG: phosphoribosylformylglycinamidine synthase [Thermoflexibacter sp.]|jgi:hypothetical protein|nr:phosphoribosylformylglycinamidine synthase [Thermoflexibacter sp.]
MKIILWAIVNVLIINQLYAQTEAEQDSLRRLENYIADTVYIDEVEDKAGKIDKVLHAEPLYIDLIRDLGARKGEAEWNIAYGMTDVTSFTRYDALIEYEFAPINRLGLEIEIPIALHKNNPSDNTYDVPSDRVNGLKLAMQYSFFVSEKLKTSLAMGYIHEFEFADLDKFGKSKLYKGNIYNPFFVAAKRWGNNFHTLIYTGGRIIKEFDYQYAQFEYAINTNLHYMISGTRNFVGIEFNKNFTQLGFNSVIRPQMRVGISDNFLIGIVTGIPTNYKQERLSTFIRLIYEPKHRKKH